MQKLIELNYTTTEFEGIMNKETFDFHHGKHLAAYVANYNAAVEGTEYESMDLADVLAKINEISLENKNAINNNGGGVFNHNMFFSQFKKGTSITDAGFISAVESSFGSVENMINELKSAGMTRFGSGWSWLVLNGGKLEVMSTANQDCPLSLGLTPILALDVWEHAYYLDYQNRRADYLASIFDIIDWQVIENRFNNAK